VTPLIFFGVADFLLHIVLWRLVRTQRDQIPILKALGYTDRRIALHYVFFAWLAVAGGVVLGLAVGIWMGRGITTLYQQFYRFPVLRFELDPDILSVAVIGGFSAATRFGGGSPCRVASARRGHAPQTH